MIDILLDKDKLILIHYIDISDMSNQLARYKFASYTDYLNKKFYDDSVINIVIPSNENKVDYINGEKLDEQQIQEIEKIIEEAKEKLK